MKLERLKNFLPSWKNALLAVLAAVLLILAFPDFEFWFLAWFALVPLLWAVERETEHGRPRPDERRFDANPRSFILGWLFGNLFFFGTCWWLTFAPITYAGFPPPLAYFLLFCVTSVAAIFPGIFAVILSILLRRFGPIAMLAAPFVWVFTEFLRYWLTGNNWNAVGYSQAFNPFYLVLPRLGGVYLMSFVLVFLNSIWILSYLKGRKNSKILVRTIVATSLPGFFVVIGIVVASFEYWVPMTKQTLRIPEQPLVVALQPNVPMSGLNEAKWNEYRLKHNRLAESALHSIITNSPDARAMSRESEWMSDIKRPPITVIFPESPMNFMYDDDEETRAFINGFAAKNNVSVLFNSAEPNKVDGKYFNSAVLVGPDGKEVAQYDKIYLLPFGESVPAPLQSIVPAFVGSFSYGSEYDLLPIGDAEAGVMICFESHFGQLSREYARRGADVIIEMTNDGYLGPTPILRQHLANAVFRAVETNRPVLRVTNVGIMAYINERGEVLDAAPPYQEDTRIWSVSKSDGSQTFYVKYGDWFAWLCSMVTVGLLILGILRKRA